MYKLQKNIIETLNFINLLEDKKLSLYNFFSQDLKVILNKLKKNYYFEDLLLSLYPNDYFFKFSNIIQKTTFLKNTPILSLFLPAEVYNLQTNQTIKFSFFICNLPIIFDNNSYLIDGTPKIINQQLTFDPGILANNKLKPSVIIIYDENQENQLYISLDDNNQIKFKYNSKILSENKALSTLNLNNYLTINEKLIENDYETSIYEKILLFSDYIKNFKITPQTRHKLNKKFNLNLPQNLLYLTEIDLKNIESTLIKLKEKTSTIIDLDDLENKSVTDIQYYYVNLLNKNLDLLNVYLSEEEKNNKPFLSLFKKVNKNSISAQIDEIFSNSEISLVLDQINILAELSQQKKVLNLKGLEGKGIPTEIRNIHPSIFGRLCIIDTPEGESAGLINSLTTLSLVNKYGLIETPLQYIRNNQIIINEKIQFFNLTTDKLHNIGFSVKFNNNFSQKFYKNIKKNKNLSKTTTQNINRKFLSYLQMFSIACSNIPFLEHNDGNRMLMGANMQKQAVPLLFPETTIVGSGLEDLIAHSSSSIKSLSEGRIIYFDNRKLIINANNGYKLTYFLDKVKKTFDETIINHTNDYFWCGDFVKFGQILVNGFSIKNSELSLGTNLTVAYMNWDGLNFEDAIIINEKLIKNDKLTSLHSKSLIIEVESNEEILHGGNTNITDNNNLNKFALIKIGSFIKKGDILLIKKETDTNNITSIESEFDGVVINIEIQDSLSTNDIVERIDINTKTIQIDILQIRKIKVGDKLSGRFGNKGVISKVIPEIDMPFLLDGTTIDILINPLGIPSRMNIGQIFETLLGFVGTTLNTKYKILPFDENFGKNATKILVNQKIKEKKLNQRQSYDNYIEDKMFVIDGRTGEIMDNPVLVGRSYILKLYHLVDDKITSRTLGPNSLITNQPVKGKKSGGGQRFGEMEVWAIEAYGASYTLNEMLNLKSDEVLIGNNMLNVMNKDLIFDDINYSKTLFIFDLDLKCLGFDLLISSFELNKDSINTVEPISLYKEKDLIMNSNLALKKLYDIK